jgi:hypothetical protein
MDCITTGKGEGVTAALSIKDHKVRTSGFDLFVRICCFSDIMSIHLYPIFIKCYYGSEYFYFFIFERCIFTHVHYWNADRKDSHPMDFFSADFRICSCDL